MLLNTDLFWLTTQMTHFSAIAVDDSQPIRNDVSCTRCGLSRHYRQYDSNTYSVRYAEEKWPDLLGPSTTSNIRIVSERVADDIAESNLSGYVLSAMECESMAPKVKLSEKYYKLSATGSADFLPIMSNERMQFVCPVCGQWNPDFVHNGYPIGTGPLSIKQWDGYDFSIGLFAHKKNFFCSRRVVELCMKKGWTNFCFDAYLQNIHISSGIINWEQSLEKQLRLYAEKIQTNPHYAVELEWNHRGIVLPEGWNNPKDTEIDLTEPPQGHLFDHLKFFDEGYWNGVAKLPCTFGLCKVFVYEDENSTQNKIGEESYSLSQGQRKLYDYFSSQQEKIVQILRSPVIRVLQGIDGLSRIHSETKYYELSSFLYDPKICFADASRYGSGEIEISFRIKGTQSRLNDSETKYIVEARPEDSNREDVALFLYVKCIPIMGIAKLTEYRLV